MTPDTRPPKTSKGDAKTEPADVDASSPKEATPKKPAATKRKPAASKEEASEETYVADTHPQWRQTMY